VGSLCKREGEFWLLPENDFTEEMEDRLNRFVRLVCTTNGAENWISEILSSIFQLLLTRTCRVQFNK